MKDSVTSWNIEGNYSTIENNESFIIIQNDCGSGKARCLPAGRAGPFRLGVVPCSGSLLPFSSFLLFPPQAFLLYLHLSLSGIVALQS
jgi:hypothetical protein